ncbi:MAG TPA: 4-hydroxythreonine-4-phosphate dehydrogenase PdxA [Ramlibacter sp.]|nr:4-hydroxythreonine-4-phosphate dehydrogenase PdxA [Ramlibacter sp.]
MKPRIAMVLGDPAGIGSELIARLLSDESRQGRADILLIDDAQELERGMEIAGRRFDYLTAASAEEARFEAGVPVLLPLPRTAGVEFKRAMATPEGGAHTLRTLSAAIDLTRKGLTDAVLFAPLNKTSLHLAGMAHNDELHWFVELLGHQGPFCEFNTLDGLWTSRVTSHVALKDVAGLITQQGIVDAIRLIHDGLQRFGIERPRIGVCGLNPHNGDNGGCGREEIDLIAPAVQAARAAGLAADGPFPADTIFLKVQGSAEQRQYDAIVTMYHDQGQIAIKLMGFSKGVTVQGGLPVPITTPAHGTAYDIAGKGVADVNATYNAFRIAARMGAAALQQRG